MSNTVTISAKLTKSVQSIVEITTLERDLDFEKFLAQLEAHLINGAETLNKLIDTVQADLPITMIIAIAQTYLIAEERPEIMVIIRAYSYAAEKDDKVINLELSSEHGKRIVKIPVHQMFKPMYN